MISFSCAALLVKVIVASNLPELDLEYVHQEGLDNAYLLYTYVTFDLNFIGLDVSFYEITYV